MQITTATLESWCQSLPILLPWTGEWLSYLADASQRTLLWMDILRKRGNLYLQHLQEGQPPVLAFDYEMILDGHTLERPVNYALVRILDRRLTPADRRRPEQAPRVIERRQRIRRQNPRSCRQTPEDHRRRPIVIIDPRAGHGPGIGGSKQDSEIGMALNAGHPVYFVLFYTDPVPGQTLADVQQAEIRFLEQVAKRHPQADKPAVIGNCQAGWAAALIGADRPDVTGPLVFNGSPLSYWSGVAGENPMRYRGGLVGGTWLSSLLSDLGHGSFDGANLVANFEDLNPANTYWGKLYHVYANVDSEEERFLNFERWWGGFFMLTAEEIHFIVSSLFVGNKLEQGALELEEGRRINLKNFKQPIVVFASSGDNITPPQQALNWIVNVYGTVDEIKRNQQVIVYIIHDQVGHLGIFVSGSVARKEHKQIINNIDRLCYLAPGLYEMVIEGDVSKPWRQGQYTVRFEERDMADIVLMDTDGREDENNFRPVAYVSEALDACYRIFARPWIRAIVSEGSAEALKQLHPLRVSRYAFSDLNGMLWPVKVWAPLVRDYRWPGGRENIWHMLEQSVSDGITATFNQYRDLRDSSHELIFMLLYDNPWLNRLAEPIAPESPYPSEKQLQTQADRNRWLALMGKGGFVEGIIRIAVALMGADCVFDEKEIALFEKMMAGHGRLRQLRSSELNRLIAEQSRILQTDEALALQSLAKLLPPSPDRHEAIELAQSSILAGVALGDREKRLLDQISDILNL